MILKLKLMMSHGNGKQEETKIWKGWRHGTQCSRRSKVGLRDKKQTGFAEVKQNLWMMIRVEGKEKLAPTKSAYLLEGRKRETKEGKDHQ